MTCFHSGFLWTESRDCECRYCSRGFV